MWKRWIIRSLFMLPILFCVVGWTWSYDYRLSITYVYLYGRAEPREARYEVLFADSALFLCAESQRTGTQGCYGAGWYFENTLNPVEDRSIWHPEAANWSGFGYWHDTDIFESISWRRDSGCVPFWFLTVFSTILLFFVWRKTRPKINPANAFPVEIINPK